MKRSLIAVAIVAALAGCQQKAATPTPSRVAPRARSLGSFTLTISPVKPSVGRAGALYQTFPVVADGDPTNPEGTFELWSDSAFVAVPGDSLDPCAGTTVDVVEAPVYLKPFTAEDLRNVAVIFTNVPSSQNLCDDDSSSLRGQVPTAPTTSYGARAYGLGSATMLGNAADPTAGGPDVPVDWRFNWSAPVSSFQVQGDVWAEPIPALCQLGDPFDPDASTTIAAGTDISWFQFPGDLSDPQVGSVLIKICADPACATVKQSGTVLRPSPGDPYTYTLASTGLTAAQSYYVALFNQWWDPGSGTTVTGSLTPPPAQFTYTVP
jgi:hypothetical protein